MKPFLSDAEIEKTIALGKFILAFGKVERTTMHEDGVTPETDAEHTVMLGVIACAFAASFAPELDRGKIAQFALVHDLVEVYAGDTPTIKITEEGQEKKDQIEREAHERIQKEFGDVYPWIHETITEYETLGSGEARFVKTLDKAMPAILHALSNGAGAKKLGYSDDELRVLARDSDERLKRTYGHDQPAALALIMSIRRKLLGEY